MRSTLMFLFLGLFSAGLALLVHEPDHEERLPAEARTLEAGIARLQQDLGSAVEAEARRFVELGAAGWMDQRVEFLEREQQRTGIVFLGLQGDSIVAWSGDAHANAAELDRDSLGHLWVGDGLYLHAAVRVGDLALHGIRPIWNEPAIENRYLVRRADPLLGVDPGLQVERPEGAGAEVRDGEGRIVCRVHWREGALELGSWIIWKLMLILLALGLLLIALWRWAHQAAVQGDPLIGLLRLAGGVVLLRALTLFLAPFSPFGRMPLFDPAVYATSVLFPSLGDLLFNAALLVLVAWFVQGVVRPAMARSLPALAVRWMLVLGYAAWITRTLIGLVHDSSVDLDLHHIQGLGGHSFAAVLAIALLFASWCLLAHALLRTTGTSSEHRHTLGVGFVTALASVAMHHVLGVVDTIEFLWPLPVCVVLIMASRRFGFVHAVLLLALLSAATAHLLARQVRDREHRERQALAERLATREDPVVEFMFREMAPRLRKDNEVYHLIVGKVPCNAADLDRLVRQRYFSGYWERYDVRLFAFDSAGQLRCATDPDPPSSLLADTSAMLMGIGVADMPDLTMEERPGQTTFYHARVAVMPADSLPPGQLILELHLRPVTQGAGFPELLLSGDDPLARRSERYAKARYEKGVLVEEHGRTFHPLQWVRPMPADGPLWYSEGRYEHLARGSVDGTLLVLGLPLPGPLDRATSFSYLFAFFGLLLSLAVALRAVARQREPHAPGIGVKVRLALVLFGLTGLVFFGLGAQRLLERQYEQRFEAAMLERMRSVHAELQYRVEGEGQLGERQAGYLEHLLGRLSNVFVTDLTLYDVQGRLLATSRPQVFTNGLLGTRMDPVAYVQLVQRGRSAFVHEEHIGTAGFSTAYMPLRDRRGTVMAYLALPSFADQVQQEEERSSVLVAVMNLFVLMFALSVLVAIFISNWTTRPLDLLRASLERVALRGTNEPLRYRGDDEVGRLVEVYNRKVEELRESAERLALSERESAWKEMARQVAHEIKNPLTPMKLSIQHFQRTWTPEAPDARERLDRFSNNLVEQIDVLSRIAGEFSHFAQMPPAHPVALDLAEVAGASVQLFSSIPGCRVRLLGEGPLPVHADREHLLRTFNNLVKNALQAIPEEREGRVEVILRREGHEAIAEVRDNGSGMPADALDHVFVPRFTTKSSGMGLGLPMVKRMVENAGGRVWFTTEEGRGTSFFVALPLRA